MIEAADLIRKFEECLAADWGYIWGTSGIMWTKKAQDQKIKYMADQYGPDWKNSADAKKNNYYYSALYGNKWIDHYVADCSGLFVFAYKQFGEKIAHGSNSIYKTYCGNKGALKGGARTDGAELKPGSAVFTGMDGARGHVGLYIGDGWVIEAKGTQAGVVKSRITEKTSKGKDRWTWWGELTAVHYDGQPVPEPTGKPTLRRGDCGEYVTLLQTLLIQHGYDLSPYGADGKFGNKTLDAVKAFQTANDLSVDGVVGRNTWTALEAGQAEFYTVTIQHVSKSVADSLVKTYGGTMIKEEQG